LQDRKVPLGPQDRKDPQERKVPLGPQDRKDQQGCKAPLGLQDHKARLERQDSLLNLLVLSSLESFLPLLPQ
jgi:hypothetical protein